MFKKCLAGSILLHIAVLIWVNVSQPQFPLADQEPVTYFQIENTVQPDKSVPVTHTQETPKVKVRTAPKAKVSNPAGVNGSETARVQISAGSGNKVSDTPMINLSDTPAPKVIEDPVVKAIETPKPKVTEIPVVKVLETPAVKQGKTPLMKVGESSGVKITKNSKIKASKTKGVKVPDLTSQTSDTVIYQPAIVSKPSPSPKPTRENLLNPGVESNSQTANVDQVPVPTPTNASPGSIPVQPEAGDKASVASMETKPNPAPGSASNSPGLVDKPSIVNGGTKTNTGTALVSVQPGSGDKQTVSNNSKANSDEPILLLTLGPKSNGGSNGTAIPPKGNTPAGNSPQSIGRGMGSGIGINLPNPENRTRREPTPTPFREIPLTSYNPAPEYPPLARKNNWEGVVILQMLVKSDGKVDAVNVMQSSNYKILDQAAIKAVKTWRFQPAIKNGAPIDIVYTRIFRFQLKADD